jgi:hypothetical protein
MLVKPGFGGTRQGYRGDDAYGGGDQVAGGGDQDFGGNDPPGPDRSKISPAQEANQRNVIREARVRAAEDFINRPRFGFTDAAKFNIAPLPIKLIQGLGGLFTGTTKPPTSVGGGDASGNLPYWAQLGFSSEEEYLRSLGAQAPAPSIMEQGTTTEDEMDKSFLRYRAEGGPIGGEYDFESARQMYGLGKLVKKIGRTVKKIAKSPIGKAALIYAGTGGLGNLAAGKGFFGGAMSNIFKPTTFLGNVPKIFSGEGIRNILVGRPESIISPGGKDIFRQAATKGIFGSGGELSPFKAIGLTSLATAVLTPEQEEEAQALAEDEGIDIEAARNSILARARDDYKMDFRARGFRAEGGIMRAGYQEGSKEPVAKKTMPLLDMGGKEMDLREDGGFVPIGRMEKADDVPARLSKNEFVFTADAVRNAGDGDVDKGAEVMYNMMKNLEAGGDVSEESQGLQGARRMFQTSQRLEEVL